jgi:hypothetical protein
MLRRIADLAYPQRLVLPVQLTLQSNTRPFMVFVAILFSVVAIVIIGNASTASWRNFTLSGEFTYIDDDQVRLGFRSSYYEDMQSSQDKLRGWPRVNSFNQSGSFVPLFLPYQPLRDNLLLDQFCKNREGAENAANRADCLRQLWSVSIEGTPVAMSGFETAERADLGMRGLVGLVPMADLEPGLRKIEVIWNPKAAGETTPVDDRYTEASVTYTIPIAFAPGYELSL